MKNILVLVIIVIIGVVGYLFYIQNNPVDDTQSATYSSDVYTFAAPEGQFTIQYNEEGTKAQLSYDGTQYELDSVVSGSGAKYENTDGTVMFWEHQGKALFEINGEEVFAENAVLVCDGKDDDCDSSYIKIDDVKGETHESTIGIDKDSDGDGLDDGATERVIAEEGIKEDLTSAKWLWKGTLNTDGAVRVEPNNPNAFVLSFTKDGSFSARTDCNTLMGEYVITGDVFNLINIASTKMACPGADIQEKEFSNMLDKVVGARVNNEGQSTLSLTLSDGSMTFIAVPSEISLEHEEIIGLTEAEAAAYAEKNDVSFRVIKRDGQYLPATADYRPGRINAEVEGGVVTAYTIEL